MTRAHLPALLLAVAACGGGATTSPSTGPEIANHPPTVATGPAPQLARAELDGAPFTWTGLPAITADGADLVVADVSDDGARANPNLSLIVKDRADAVVERQVILDPDHQDGDWRTALTEANHYLDTLNATRDLHPMTAMVDDPEAGVSTARGAGYDLVWDETHVYVRRGDDVIVDREQPSWATGVSPACDPQVSPTGGADWTWPSRIEGAWIDAERKVVLFRLVFLGSDACWEPDGAFHVVGWE
ncbi:MAG: hypothetical protein H6708_14125 [Kofleriaceae bacterium]|nr:hypothetical protein [Kofleriaceae bacterium]